jgi:hypothetical protein
MEFLIAHTLEIEQYLTGFEIQSFDREQFLPTVPVGQIDDRN